MSTQLAQAPTSTAAKDGSRTRRLWLHIDAMMSSCSGLALLAGSAMLDEPLGIDLGLLVGLGVVFLAYGGVLVVLARRGARRNEVRVVAFANLAWVALSVAVVVADTLTLTTAGIVFAIAQAVAVLVVAENQLLSARAGTSRN